MRRLSSPLNRPPVSATSPPTPSTAGGKETAAASPPPLQVSSTPLSTKAASSLPSSSSASTSATPGGTSGGLSAPARRRSMRDELEDSRSEGLERERGSLLSGKVKNIFDSYRTYLDYHGGAVVDPSVAAANTRSRFDVDSFVVSPNAALDKATSNMIARSASRPSPLLNEFLTVKKHPLSDFHPLPIEALRGIPVKSRYEDEDSFLFPGDRPTFFGESEPSFGLQVDSYTSIVEADREHPFLVYLLSEPPPDSMDIFLGIDGRRSAAQCRRQGNILKATLPPLSAGRHFLSLRTSRGNVIPLVLPSPDRTSSSSTSLLPVKGSKSLDLSKELTPVYALPLMAVKAPRKRPEPQLCYSTLKNRTSRPLSASATGPYTAEDLEELVQATTGALEGHARFLLPRMQGSGPRIDRTGRLVAEPKGVDFTKRLSRCLNTATKKKKEPDFGGLETILVESAASNCDVRIPLPFKISLFNSCTPAARLSITCFHSRVFQFEPYGVLSAQIFTKSRYSDVYTIFTFSLTPVDIPGPNAPMPTEQKPNLAPYIPSLDRFEATDRLCADTRFWRYVDGCIPLKNEVASHFVIEDFNHVECPVPAILRHARNPYREYPPGLQIAPGVFLFFEPWPSEDILPMPKHFSLESSSRESSDGDDDASAASSSPAMQALDRAMEGICKPAIRAKAPSSSSGRTPEILVGGGALRSGEATKREKESETTKISMRGQDERTATVPQYFSLTLCVGCYLFTSVVGVEAGVLEFIVNRWLHFVPESKKKKKNPAGAAAAQEN